jgi:hypothetical protein
MSGKSTRLTLLLTASMSLASACSSLHTAPKQGNQIDAIARWNRCVARFADQYSGSHLGIGKRADTFCEGHRRDVVATFPRHLENQVDSLLSQRANAITTARYVRTAGSDTWSRPKDAQLDTLKTLLNETRSTEL